MSISVIVATYGDDAWEQRAERACESVRPQLATDHHGEDELIRLHVSGAEESPATLRAVRNAAASQAVGDWLCFVDADDEIEPGYLDAMRNAPRCVEHDGACPRLLVPSVRYVHPDGRADEPCIPNRTPPRQLWEVNCAVIGTLIPRSLFEMVGGFHEWPMYEDWDLWLRAVALGAELVDVPEAIYRANISPGGRNVYANRRTIAEETYWAIRKQHDPAYQ